jgi:cytosine/adenosine deaminase-related metal-dependent hydrolase
LDEERAEGALLPGLVNAHTHVELSALNGRLSGGQGVPAWAMQVGRELSRFSAEQRFDASVRAVEAMADKGTAAVGDVGNGLTAVCALAEVGMGGIFFHEMLGSREAAKGDALADAQRERTEFLEYEEWPDNVTYMLAPHALYSAGSDLLRRIFAATASAAHPTTIHMAEGQDEVHLLRDGSGAWAEILAKLQVPAGSRTPKMGPLTYLESLGAFAGRAPLLVHMVCADAEDVAVAKRHKAPVVLCPRSNVHIGGRLPDVPALVGAGLLLALGTDSLGSAPDLSLWGEMALLSSRFSDIAPEHWLTAATLGGAQALGLDALGAFMPGKRPGIIEVALAGDSPARSLVANPDPAIRWVVEP